MGAAARGRYDAFSMKTIHYQRNGAIPVVKEADVVVIGGGPGGMSAAVMAAREGARVLLVERYGAMGGMASYGEIHPFMPNHLLGKCLDKPVYVEWIHRMQRYCPSDTPPDGEVLAHEHRLISKDAAMLAAEDLCLEAGVQLLFHHQLADVLMDGGSVKAAVLLSKSGFSAVQGKMFIDASGDADLCAMAGCPIEIGGPSGHCQPMTLCFKLCDVDRARMPKHAQINALYLKAKAEGRVQCPREDVLWFTWFTPEVIHFNTTRVIHKSGTNGVELSEAEIEARRQVRQLLEMLRSDVPGFEKARIYSMAHHIGVRESRRVRGLAYLTKEAFIERKKFDDAIARVRYSIDIHNPDGTGTEHMHLPEDQWYEIPYGCIVPQGVSNLLVAGRPISVDHAIHSSMRVMPPACSVGQAAGMAAAMAVREGKRPGDLDGVAVRQRLRERGAAL